MRTHVHVFLVMVTPANVHEMMVHNVQALLPHKLKTLQILLLSCVKDWAPN